MASSPLLIFAGFMLPVLLTCLVRLSPRWSDMRWPAAVVAVYLGMMVMAVLCARYASRVQMTRRAAVALVTVAPGITDWFAYGIGLDSAILTAAVYFTRGLTSGLAALAVDMAALAAGARVTTGAISPVLLLATLSGPVSSIGLAAAMRAAFRSLSSQTELQLAGYRERLRHQALAEAIGRVDSAAPG